MTYPDDSYYQPRRDGYPQQGYAQQPYQQAPPPGYYQQPQQRGPEQQYAPPQGYQSAPGYRPAHHGGRAAAPPRRRRRVFLWVFLAIQALFLIWLVAGLAGTNTAAPHAQVAAACYHHSWWPLYKSQADCVTHFGRTLTAAGDVGKGLGAAFIVVIWVVLDFFLGLGYLIYKLSTRSR